MTVLVLGGTAEARALATELTAAGIDLVSSLAGRVRDPALPPGRVRVGGFGGPAGLADYLRTARIAAVVDATHPFARQISTHAVAATRIAGVALLRLARPGWADHPDAETWTWVPDTAAAVTAGARAERPFLTTGRQSLEEFLSWADRPVLVRVVDPPDFDLPKAWTLIRSRGPYPLEGERALLREHRIDLLVTKDSGGEHTEAKLTAARELGATVVVIARPVLSPVVEQVTAVADAVSWVENLETRTSI